MKTSDAGLKFIAQEEGTVLHVYKDTSGYLTVGVGHLLSQAEISSGVYDKGITYDQAIALLKKDVAVTESWVDRSVRVPITQNQYDALASFAFNEGGGALFNSTLMKYLNAGNVQGAADEFLKWCKAMENGQLVVNQGILGRRKRERALFLKPDPVATPAPAPTPVVEQPAPEPAPVVVQPTPEPVPAPVTPPTPAPVATPSSFQAIINFIMTLLKAFFGGK